MVESVLLASCRIVHKLRDDKEEYLVRLNRSGLPEIEQISGTINTKSPVHPNYYIRGRAYIGYALNKELVGHIFEAKPITDIAFLKYMYTFSLMMKDVELLRVAGDKLPKENSRSPYVNEIFIDEGVADSFSIGEGQRVLLKVNPLFKPAQK